MDQEKNYSFNDGIDLDEIRELLGDGEKATPADADAPEESAFEEATSSMDPTEEECEQIETDEAEEIFAETEDEETAESEPVDNEAEEPTAPKKKINALKELYGMLHDVIYLLAAVTLVFVFVVRLVGVQGDSMLPTLHNGDYLVLESNFLFGGDDLEYGDVVVINLPEYQHNTDGPIVKRIIATEGQTVDIDFNTGMIHVDGVRLVEDYINQPTYYNWEGEFALQYPVTVPEGCVFVLGDNRNNSMDSRYAPIGMVDEQYVLGKVLFIVLPGQTTDGMGNVIDPRQWGRIGLVS